MERTYGRIRVGNRWRPAYLVTGIVYVSPSSYSTWRMATPVERATWQILRDQHTAGRVWDDAHYVSD